VADGSGFGVEAIAAFFSYSLCGMKALNQGAT
jgi:hypothetical protein